MLLVLLELVVKIVLSHVFDMLDSNLSLSPRVFRGDEIWACNLGVCKADALWAIITLDSADKSNLLVPVRSKERVDVK